MSTKKKLRPITSTTRELDHGQYSDIIDRWNGLKHSDRKARARECDAEAHKWVMTPLDVPMCIRCIKYDMTKATK